MVINDLLSLSFSVPLLTYIENEDAIDSVYFPHQLHGA